MIPGKRGGGSGMHGECGGDIVVRVPVGTIIRKAQASQEDQELDDFDFGDHRLDGFMAEHSAEDLAELLVPGSSRLFCGSCSRVGRFRAVDSGHHSHMNFFLKIQ